MGDGMNDAYKMIWFSRHCTELGIPWTSIKIEIEQRDPNRWVFFDRITITQDGPISWLDMETLRGLVERFGCEVHAINTQEVQ